MDKLVRAYVFGRDLFDLTIVTGLWMAKIPKNVRSQDLQLEHQTEQHRMSVNNRLRGPLVGYLPINVAFAIIAFPINTYRVGFLPQFQPSFGLNPLPLQLFYKRLPPECTEAWVSNRSIAKTLDQ